MKSEGLMPILEVHYSSQAFVSKFDDYWGNDPTKENFLKHYLNWCAYIGLKYAPDAVTLKLCKEAILKDFGHMNENSVMDALRLNLLGAFKTQIEPYGAINAAFLIKTLTEYNKALKSAHKRAVEARNELLAPRELSEAEKEQKLRSAIIDAFTDFKNGIEDSISWPIYDYLKKINVITIETVPADVRKEFHERAKSLSKVQLLEGLSLRDAHEAKKKFDAGDFDDQIVKKAKTMAVNYLFTNLEKLDI
jgi:hypothetical protein